MSEKVDISIDVPPLASVDWVAYQHGSPPDIGRVVRCYKVYDNTFCMDLKLFSLKGTLLGRTSPAEGGPKSYEPALPVAGWVRIKKPAFPTNLQWIPKEDDPEILVAGFGGFKVIGFRTTAVVTSRPVALGNIKTDFDPRLEAASRRMAAQTLRDVNRKTPNQALIDEAVRLEKEAETFEPKLFAVPPQVMR
jgi:hypothetical protein